MEEGNRIFLNKSKLVVSERLSIHDTLGHFRPNLVTFRLMHQEGHGNTGLANYL